MAQLDARSTIRPRQPRRVREGMAGVSAVALALAGGKWGARLGIPPIFPIDVLLLFAFVHAVAGAAVLGTLRPQANAHRSWPGYTVTALLVYVTLRFAMGPDHSLTAIRDYAPYAYAIIAFLSARAYYVSGHTNRERTARLLNVALLCHLAWVAFATVLPTVAQHGPVIDDSQNLRIFQVRLDSDGLLVGLTGALYFVRYLRHGGKWRLLIALGSFGLVLSLASRAALLGTVVATLLSLGIFSAGTARTGVAQKRWSAVLAVLPAFIVLSAAALPMTTAGSKLLAGIGLIEATSPVETGGIGSQQARIGTWGRIERHVSGSGNQMTGVGFGPNFMLDSGASVVLLHSENEAVRSPHNFLVGTYARLGAIGLSLVLALTTGIVAAIYRVRRRAADDDLLLICCLIPPAVFVTAAFGVVLEAPFGAVPFFWASGVLLTHPARQESSPTLTALRP
jgi:hypothetical protein